MKFRFALLTVLAVSVSACSSITQGTTQEILVNTNPNGADCTFEREGIKIATLSGTPASANISKTKHDVTIKCVKEGYQDAQFINDSGWESGSGAAGVALDVVLTLGLSSAIDSATGADNKYTSPVNITMIPDDKIDKSTSNISDL